MTNTETPTKTCPICSSPGGECYRICPNSESYYSPEQERRDADDFEHGGYQAQLAAEHLAEAADCWSEAEDTYYAEQGMREDAHLEAAFEDNFFDGEC